MNTNYGTVLGKPLFACLLVVACCQSAMAESTALMIDQSEMPLSEAISRIGQRYGLNIGADAALLRRHRAPAVKGILTIDQAVAAALARSGLRIRRVDDKTMVIERAPAASRARPLSAVTVTGELQQRNLQQVISSVFIADGEALDDSTDANLYDLVRRTPNISNVFGEQGFSIRGIRQGGVGGAGSGRLVDVQVDGVSLPTSQSTFFGPYSTWDLQQVEVLRGPQSTQTGRNALAGAIKLRGREPVYGDEFSVRTEIGERNTSRLSFVANKELSSDKAALRLSVDRHATDGFVTNPTRNEKDYDGRLLTNTRLALKMNFSPQLEGIFTYSLTNNHGGQDFIEAGSLNGVRTNRSDYRAEEGSFHRIGNARLSYQISPNLRLKSETSLYRHSYVRVEDGDDSATPGNYVDRGRADKSFSQELRLHIGQPKQSLRGVLGLYYTRINADSRTVARLPGTIIDPALAGTSVVGSIDSETRVQNTAIFGELDWQASQRWLFTVGGRLDKERRQVLTVSERVIDPPVITLPAVPDQRTHSDFSVFLPKLALSYEWSKNLSAGISVQKGYRAGGATLNLVDGLIYSFDPESALTYDLSLRSLLMGGRMRFDANVFRTNWKDQQLDVAGPSGTSLDTRTVNAGESSLHGLELSVSARPTPSVDVYAAYGYVKTQFDQFQSGADDLSGNQFPHAPRSTIGVGGRWQVSNAWSIGGGVAYTGAYFDSAENTAQQRVPSRTLVNLKLAYEQKDWSLALITRNLADKQYFTQITANGQSMRSGEPRYIGLQFRGWY